MLDLINDINEMGWNTTLTCFILVICVIITAVTGYNKLLSVLGLQSSSSIRQKQLDESISELKEQITLVKDRVESYKKEIVDKQHEYHDQSISIRNGLSENQNDLKNDIRFLQDMLQKFMTDQNQSTVAMMRSSLWQMHKDFCSQRFITPDGLKTFLEMGKAYENAGGDDIYHEKLLPEVESLPIRYPEGSIYNQPSTTI